MEDMSRAYGIIAATSLQASTMPSAGGLDSGTVYELATLCPGARQQYAEVEVREPREPFPSQIPRPAQQVAECEDLLCSSTRTTGNGTNRGGVFGLQTINRTLPN